MKILEYLKNPIIFGLLVGLIMVLLMYINSKISKKENSKSDYFKIFFSAGAVSGGLQFLLLKSNISDEILQDKPASSSSAENLTESITKSTTSKRMHTDIPNW